MWSSSLHEPTCVVILFSIHFVLKAEKLLKNDSIVHDVIPVPREISSDCGMAVEFLCRDQARVMALLQASSLRIAGLYSREGESSFQPLQLDPEEGIQNIQ
ncbi:MAG: DUF3343 domain-containing protein [Pseudomonadota bacterium]